MTNSKILNEGLTYEDVLLIPQYSDILPQKVNLKTIFSKNIDLNIPIVSAAMDTVTEFIRTFLLSINQMKLDL